MRQSGPDIGHKKPWEKREEAAQIVVTFDDNQIAMRLFGRHSENLALLERRLEVQIDQRGNHITIEGSREACDQARLALESLYDQLRNGQEVTSGDVDGAVRHALTQPAHAEEGGDRTGFEQFRLRKRLVRARTPGQDVYLKSLKKSTLVFATGPAGTGKTWLAVAYAVHLFERREVDRIVLSRPAVEAGERLGFLPGDMREKVDPYLRPIYDAFYELMDRAMVERLLQSGEIEIAPLAFMRGRTLSNSAVILDEAQNTTSMQMKMFLTRLGEHSRMIVTGDPSQIDLPAGQTSGLDDAVRLIGGLEDVSHCAFSAADVVRHELVSRIVNAYDAADAAKKKPGERT